MKKNLYLTLALCLTLFTTKAQVVIPNYNLEKWDTSQGIHIPEDWVTSDLIYSFFGIKSNSVMQSKTSNSGKYAMKITSDSVSVFGQTEVVNGFAATQFASASRPAYLTGYYRSNVKQNDTAAVVVLLSRYNSATGESDTVGAGFISLNAVTEYSRFAIPIYYVNNLNPDSISILAAIYSEPGKPFSHILLDDLMFTNGLSVEKSTLPNMSQISIYPNPAQDYFQVSVNAIEGSQVQIEVKDMQGRRVRDAFNGRWSYGKEGIKIETQGLPGGSYLIEARVNGRPQYGRLMIK